MTSITMNFKLRADISFLFCGLRMSSIITVMKLACDSESGAYYTFHNLPSITCKAARSVRILRVNKMRGRDEFSPLFDKRVSFNKVLQFI